MFEKGPQVYGGDGIITKGVENTLDSIGRLGREGGGKFSDKALSRKKKAQDVL